MPDKTQRFIIQISGTQTVVDLMSFIDDLQPDKKYEVTIKPYRHVRSKEQNAYLWGVVYETISQETGYLPDEVHQIFAEMFLSYEHKGKQFVKSTTLLTTVEMEDYLSKVRMFASTDLHIYIELPNEKKWSDTK